MANNKVKWHKETVGEGKFKSVNHIAETETKKCVFYRCTSGAVDLSCYVKKGDDWQFVANGAHLTGGSLWTVKEAKEVAEDWLNGVQ